MKHRTIYISFPGLIVIVISSLFITSCSPDVDKLKSNGDVQKLINALYSDNVDIRRDAAEALGELGDPNAVDPLLRVLNMDRDSSVQQAAAEAVGEIGDQETVDQKVVYDLMGEMAERDTRIPLHGVIVESLLKLEIEEHHIDSLGRSLTDLDDSKFENTFDIVLNGNNPSEKVVPWITALGASGDDRAVEILLIALTNEDPSVRQVAAVSLGKTGNSRAVQPLLDAFSKQPVTIDSTQYYETIARSLIELGVGVNKHSIETLSDALVNLDNNAFAEVVDIALDDANEPGKVVPWITALGIAGDIRSKEALMTALENGGEEVREEAAIQLGKIGDDSALEPLLTALEDENFKVRQAAAEALGDIADPQAVEGLVSVILSDDHSVRESAAQALGSIGKPGIEALISAYFSDSFFSGNALHALSGIGEPAEEIIVEELSNFNEWEQLQHIKLLILMGSIDPVIDPLNGILDSNSVLSKYAAGLLGKTHDDRAVQSLVDVVAVQSDQEICGNDLRYYIDALIELGQNISNQDKITEIENVLLESLNKCGTESMADTFLNSGNQQLEKAAETWAKNNGFTVISVPGGSGKSWGGP